MKKVTKRHWYYIIVMAIILWFGGKAAIITFENHRLAKSGKLTKGLVTNKEWESASYRNPDGFYYQFTIDSIMYVGHTFDNKNGPFDTIDVIYLPTDPSLNRPLEFINNYYK